MSQSVIVRPDENGKDPVFTPANDIYKIRDGFQTIDTQLWTVSQDANDLVEVGGNTQGSGYIKISKSVDTDDTETTFLSNFIIKAPFRLGLGMSLSQRLNHQRFSLELVGVDETGKELSTIPVAPAIPLNFISQATTTLTIDTTPIQHGLVPNDRIAVYDVNDSRANYGELLVATVVNLFQITCTATASATIPSTTITQINGSGSLVKIDPLSRNDNSFAVIWEGTSASNAKLVSRASGGALFNGSDTSLGTNHTNATVANTNAYADALNPSYMYDLKYKTEGIIVRTMPMDSTGAYGSTLRRAQSLPDIENGYKIRIKARNNTSMSKVVATISNAVKAASTTATITTSAPHGLTTTDYVMIYGIADQTNFANLTAATAVASVIDATTFTVAFGASFTGNARGGVVLKINGSYTQAPSAQVVQSISRTNNLMTVIGNATWTGFSVGDTIDLKGLVDSSTGASYAIYEGAYKVAAISTTSLVLRSTGADFTSLSCGGAVLKRTDLRLHFMRVLDYTRHVVDIDQGGNSGDYQDAMGVNVIALPSVTVSSWTGQAAHDSAIAGNPMRVAARALTANYATVATGDTADLVTTLVGALIQKPYAIPELDWSYAAPSGGIIVSTDVVLKAAGAAGIRNYVTGMQIQNVHATVATEIVIKDNATVIWRGYLPANMSQPVDVTFANPLRTTAATVLNFACITTGAQVYVNTQGYQAP